MTELNKEQLTIAWIKQGLTDDQIQEKLKAIDVAENADKIKQQDARDNTDNLQETINRIVAAINKNIDTPIEDLEVSGRIGGTIPFHTTITANNGNAFYIEQTVAGVKQEGKIISEIEYEEKEVIITPAVVEKWVRQLDPNTGALIKESKYDYKSMMAFNDGTTGNQFIQWQYIIKSTTGGTDSMALLMSVSLEDLPHFHYFWVDEEREITPAVKATVLVKK